MNELPLAHWYTSQVLEDSEVVARFSEFDQTMRDNQFPSQPAVLPKRVPVKYETWNYDAFIWSYSGLSYDLQRIKPVAREVIIDQGNSLRIAGEDKLKSLINKLRTGELIVKGLPAEHHGSHELVTVPGVTWSYPYMLANLAENSLQDTWEGVTGSFVELVAKLNTERPGRIRGACSFLEAVDALAEPKNQAELRRARNENAYEYGAGSIFLDEDEAPERKRARARYSHYQSLDEHLRSEVERLLRERAISIEFWKKLDQPPAALRAELLPRVELNFEESTIQIPGSGSWPAQIVIADHVQQAVSQPTVVRAKEAERKRGRPSRANEIMVAWRQLTESGLVDLTGTLQKAIEAVRKRILDNSGDSDLTGIGDAAISRTIRREFWGLHIKN